MYRVKRNDLPDARMQNTALLREIIKNNLIPGLTREYLIEAYNDLLKGSALTQNLGLLE